MNSRKGITLSFVHQLGFSLLVSLAIILFFLLFLLGDIYYRWILLPSLVVVVWLVVGGYNKATLDFSSLMIGKTWYVPAIWFLFVAWQGVALFFSRNIGLSLDSVLAHFSVFSLFLLVLLRPKKLRSEDFVYGTISVLVLMGIVLSILSIGFILSPKLAAQLPGFNLLHATYGHNHLASYLILILPLSWWLSIRTRSKILIAMSLFLAGTLATSFGRVAVFIGLLQLLVIAWVVFKKQTLLRIDVRYLNLVQIAIQVLVALFLAILFFKAFFSITAAVFPQLSTSISCPVPQLRMQLCKTISTETRPEYWSQALQAFSYAPIFGYGPGTFALVSNRFTTHPSKSTAFAHNASLQFFAESGLVGGMTFSALILVSLYLLWRKIQTAKDPLLQIMICITLASLFVNNLLDFDWSFMSIASTVAVLMALGLGGETIDDGKMELNQIWVERLRSLMFGLLNCSILVIVGMSLLVGYAEYLFIQKQYSRLLSVFPYVSHHRIVLSEYESWSQKELDSVFDVYRWHPHSLEILLERYPDYPRWLDMYHQLDSISFGFSFSNPLFIDWAEQHLSKEERLVAYNQLLDVAQKYQEKNEFYRYYPLKQIFIKTYLSLANEFYADGDLEIAADMYLKVYQVDEWALGNTEIAFTQTFEDGQQVEPDLQFLRKVVARVGDKLGYNSDAFTQKYLQRLDLSSEYIYEDMNNIVSIAPWKSYDLWKLSSTQLQSQIQVHSELDSTDSTAKELELTQIWFRIWRMLESAKTNEAWDLEYVYKRNLAEILQAQVSRVDSPDEKIQLVNQMQELLSLDYIAMAQLGHLYMSLEMFGEARVAYQACLDRFESEAAAQYIDIGTHYECKAGLDLLDKGFNWPDRFDQLKQIFEGSADWSDFGAD